MIIPELIVREVVPPISSYVRSCQTPATGDHVRACIAVQQRLRLEELLAVLATLALECLVRLAEGLIVVLEQLPEVVAREEPLDVFLLVYDSRRQRLLLRLPLENLLLDCARRDESVHETWQKM